MLDQIFAADPEATAVVWNNQSFSYAHLRESTQAWRADLVERGITRGSVVSLAGDFSPNGIGLLLALVEHCCITVPLLRSPPPSVLESRFRVASVQHHYQAGDDDVVDHRRLRGPAEHPFYETIRRRGHPGLVLFSSGTSGEPKAAVHDFSRLLKKFTTRRASLRMLNFLLFDHWGGLNTMFHTLFNGGALFTVQRRDPAGICRLIARHRIEVLPASPSFLNLLLMEGSYRERDLSSLKIITYGTEPMPATTLNRLQQAFPDVKLQQTYGLIELGVLRSKSRSSGSLWVKVGGEGYETRVVDGMLQIKAEAAMLGYLNAPSPFTHDGWFMTGDAVEVDGDYIRILGRKSELINVGGEKVYPQEVENCLLALPNVAEATVYGVANPLLGFMVCAKVRLAGPEDAREAVRRLKRSCAERLEAFKVPVKIQIVDELQVGDRLKKVRAEQ